MNFSAISDRTAIGKLVRLPLRLVPREARVRILQGRLKGMRWIAGSGVHGYWLGSYEYEKQRVLERVLREGDVVFDVGANVGFYSLLASVLVGAAGRVFAFEPLPRNLDYLKQHLRLNAIQNVVVIGAAVSDCDGEVPFVEGASDSTGYLASRGLISVRVTSVDSAVGSGTVPPPDCLKIDVEGAEGAVLLGARETLTRYHPAVLLATHAADVHDQCCRILGSLGYELISLQGKPVEDSDELLGNYRGRNGAAGTRGLRQ